MNPISFEKWIAQFPNQELAEQILMLANSGYFQNPEELLWNAITAYRKAQESYNLNPELTNILETVGTPVIGTLADTENPTIKTQRITYTVAFVSQLEIASTGILGWQKPKP